MAAMKLEVVGLLGDLPFHSAKCTAEDLYKENASKFPQPAIKGMFEFEWNLYIEEKKRELKGETWMFSDKCIVFIDGQLVGGPFEFRKWAEENCGYKDFRPHSLYKTLAEQAYKQHLNDSKHDFVFLDIQIGDEPAGRLLIELFSDIVPKTCENFRALCTGEKGISELSGLERNRCYKDTCFHRIVRNGWIQGGDIYNPCAGDGGESIYGQIFEDENFAVQHTRRGILGMANKGRHTNGSQFYFTLQPSMWMNTKYVAFGQIIEGTDVLKKMEEQETYNERPVKDVKVVDCGVVTFEF